ncbi:unnamed protein product [Auanema sp. JU1783]|nr:unnamed protein product [Auanema sp. JU1783]
MEMEACISFTDVLESDVPDLEDLEPSMYDIIPSSYELTRDLAHSSAIRSSLDIDAAAGPRQKLQNAIAAVKNEHRLERNGQYATSVLKGSTWTVQSQNQYSSNQRQPSTKAKLSGRTYSTLSKPEDLLASRGSVSNSWARHRDSSPLPSHRYNTLPINPRHLSLDPEGEDEIDQWAVQTETKYSEDIGKEFTVAKRRKQQPIVRLPPEPSTHPKPGFSYSSLIGLALKNSVNGQLTVSEIYAFILENFPYFRTAPSGWKNSVRHNLSLNKCFKKVDIDPSETQTARKSCLWMISPDKLEKVEQDIRKWRDRNPDPAAHGLARPQDMLAIEEGTKGLPTMNPESRSYRVNNSSVIKSDPVSTSPTHSLETYDFIEPSNHLDVDVEMKLDFLEEQLCFSPTPSHESLSIHSDESIQPPFKRPYSHILASPPKEFLMSRSLLLVSPPRNKKEVELSVSPIRYLGCSSFDIARDALNDNSLMSAALGQSPYKGPVTFPAF